MNDTAKIMKVVNSFESLLIGMGLPCSDKLSLTMDLELTHTRTPLDLDRMIAEDVRDEDILHDVAGIRNHIDRSTGMMNDFFSPRFTLRNQ